MSLPSIKVNFDDYQLGLVPEIVDTHAKLGVAVAGPYTPQRLTRGIQVLETYQGGALAGAAAVALITTSPVIGVRVPASVVGQISAVTASGGATPLTVSGEPNEAYAVTVSITRSGDVVSGQAAVIISVGGVDAVERAVPVNGVLGVPGTGVSVTLSGTLTAAQTYTFTTTAPAATLNDIVTALDSLLASRPALRYIHILGTATRALAAAVDAVLMERESRNYYTHALLEARPMNDGEGMMAYLEAVGAEFDGFASTRVSVALDGGEVFNPLTRRLEQRNSAWKLSAQRATRPIGEAPYRVRTGALAAMGGLRFDANLTETTGRFAALRTFDIREGVYVAAWPTLAPAGSDYGEVQRREVIDRCAQLGYLAALDYLGDDIPVDPTTGRILETEALHFEAFVEGRIRAGVGSNASGIRVRVDRDENILSTEHIEFTVSCIPLGYMKTITVNVGFLNPFLVAETAAASTATTSASTGATTTTTGGNA